jgi:large subunit ribosomal protein L18
MYRMIRRRRRSSETNYLKRVELVKGGMPRLVVRASNRRIRMQVIEYREQGDAVLASANSAELKGFGWEPRGNMPTAYLTGLLLSRKWKGERVALDIGIARPVKGSVVFAAAKGAQDGGMGLLGSIEVSEERLRGAHIAAYAKEHKERFTAYAKAGVDPASIAESFEAAKKKLMSK